MSHQISILRKKNSNLRRTTVEGELPKSSQGLFPPYVRAYYTEQYGGRETSIHFYQEPQDDCWAVLQETADSPELSSLNAGSCLYKNFIEIWNGNKLIAIICGANYSSPEQHLEKHRSMDRREHCHRYKLGQFHLDLLEKNGEKAVIDWFERTMKIPVAWTEEGIKKKYPGYTPRETKTLVF